jgi:phosphate-selective porin OprO and OprP
MMGFLIRVLTFGRVNREFDSDARHEVARNTATGAVPQFVDNSYMTMFNPFFRPLLMMAMLTFLPVLSIAQDRPTRDVREQIGDDIRFPALPYYSYGQGLGLTTPDSTFRLNIRFRMQNRASYADGEGRDPAIDAAVRRLRLRFDGFVGDPRFLYAIQLSFAPGDVGEVVEGDNINIIRDAVMFWQPNRYWSVGFGQTKLPGNRQRVNSSGALQLTDRSINNARFSIDRDYGVHLYYQNEDRNRPSFSIKTAVSTGEGRNWTRDPDTKLAWTAKLEFFPFGTFLNNGTLFEGDLAREEDPRLMISGVVHYNQGARRTRGQLGDDLFEPRDMTSLMIDAMLKYRGWSLMGAWMTRRSGDPVTVHPDDPSLIRYVFAGNGYDLQASYLFAGSGGYELIGRYSHQSPDRAIWAFVPDSDQYSFGVNKYVWEHSLKLQAELTTTTESRPAMDDRRFWYVRFQVEIGI